MEFGLVHMMESKYNDNYTDYLKTPNTTTTIPSRPLTPTPDVYKWCITNAFTLEHTIYYIFLDKAHTNVDKVAQNIQSEEYDFITSSIPLTIIRCDRSNKYYLLTKNKKYIENIDYLIETFNPRYHPYRYHLVSGNVDIYNPFFTPEIIHSTSTIDMNISDHIYPHMRVLSVIKHDAFSQATGGELFGNGASCMNPYIPGARTNIEGTPLEYVFKYDDGHITRYVYITKQIIDRYI